MAPSHLTHVTVEEIDQSLLEIAAHNEHSSPEVRAAKKSARCDIIEILGNIYRRLRSREAKWLTRLILKDFGAVKFPEELSCGPNIRSLPQCVLVQAKFKSSLPESERRDGPGRMRLAAAAKAYGILPPTPPRTAPKPTIPLTSTISTIENIPLSPIQNGASIRNVPTRIEQSDRKPLTELSAESTQNSPSEVRHRSPQQKKCTPNHSMTHCISPESPSKKASMARREVHSTSPILVCGRGKCRLTKGRCPLDNCIFLLAPCISTLPLITGKLFRWHGSRYVKSPEVFTHSYPLNRSGKSYQRIVLVEPRRMEETIEFLHRIVQLNSKRQVAHKSLLDVYDWRILECIAKVDRGQRVAHKSLSKYRICRI